jgi:hypothetical protein
MAVVGAAAAAQQVDLRIGLHEVAILSAELDRIARVNVASRDWVEASVRFAAREPAAGSTPPPR